ncbi:MAG: hypothetical protein B6D39_13010 [Anaerolineae bacterium UTCFX2]|jgi:hypothetical protein|nr:hypothetical protein [Anaerolineales bacterium]OQY87362.1 MAG: hypothetical protein B6D39_13010 [Anaerolineae bacterium UTCFX2]
MTDCTPFTRSLYAWEVQQARRVFGTRLDYEQVRIHECAAWSNTLDRFGRKMKGMPAPVKPNAVTLGRHCYFPVRLLEFLAPPEHAQSYLINWLIHELTHVWQFERLGWSYLFKALQAQFAGGAQAYKYGGEAGLQAALQQNHSLLDFNPEQQGDICRDYYDRLRRGLDVTAWQPFIDQIQQATV